MLVQPAKPQPRHDMASIVAPQVANVQAEWFIHVQFISIQADLVPSKNIVLACLSHKSTNNDFPLLRNSPHGQRDHRLCAAGGEA
jgi:hypothetical protein